MFSKKNCILISRSKDLTLRLAWNKDSFSFIFCWLLVSWTILTIFLNVQGVNNLEIGRVKNWYIYLRVDEQLSKVWFLCVLNIFDVEKKVLDSFNSVLSAHPSARARLSGSCHWSAVTILVRIIRRSSAHGNWSLLVVTRPCSWAQSLSDLPTSNE